MKATPGFLVTVVCYALLALLSRGAEQVDPAAFDKNGNRVLELDELRFYVIKRDKLTPDPKAFLTENLTLMPDAEARIRTNLFDQADFRVGEIYGQLNVPSGTPIPVEQLRQLVKPDSESGKEKGFNIPGLYAESRKLTNGVNGSLSPFVLRKTADDWSSDLKKAQGAKITYSDDRESHKTTWSTEGALIYPLAFSDDYTAYDREKPIRSERWLLLPAVGWNVNKTAQTAKSDIEELQWQVPVVWSANHVGLGWLRNSELALTPYVLTDFSFKGLVEGFSVGYSAYVFDNGSGFGINTGYKGLGNSPLMYRLGLVPALDYNHLSSTSRFISRTDHDDYVRWGGKLEAGLITKGYPSLESVVSYQPMIGIAGAPDYSYLLSLSGKLWLNKYAGFSVDYQRGNTPVAQKDIDLLTAGLEVKF